VPPLADAGVDAPDLQAVLDRALAREPQERFATALEMADALEACGTASASEVGAWVADMAADTLAQRTVALQALDQLPSPDALVPTPDSAPALAPRGRSPALAVGLVALALAAVAAIASFSRRSDAPAPAAVTPATTAAPAPTANAPTTGSPTPTVTAAPTPAVNDANPAAPAPTPVDASPTSALPTKAPAVKARPPPAEPVVARPADAPKPTGPCDPPFTIDASGVKRFKVECLK
jgi:hypothetical protein